MNSISENVEELWQRESRKTELWRLFNNDRSQGAELDIKQFTNQKKKKKSNTNMREQTKMHRLKNTGIMSETNHKGINSYGGTIETAVNKEK